MYTQSLGAGKCGEGAAPERYTVDEPEGAAAVGAAEEAGRQPRARSRPNGYAGRAEQRDTHCRPAPGHVQRIANGHEERGAGPGPILEAHGADLGGRAALARLS